MAARFDGSTSYISNTAPQLVSTGYPFSVAAWVYPLTLANRTFVSFTDSGSTNNYLELQTSGGGQWAVSAVAGGTANNAVAGTGVANAWTFLIGRFISSTNRRISALQPDGSIVAAAATTARAPTGLDTISVGARAASTPASFYNALIGEFWYCNADVQSGSDIATTDSLVRALAYGGPFSVPSVAKSLIEYRSLRKHPIFGGRADIWRSVGVAASTWANIGGATIGLHPPLPYWYVRPNQTKRALVPI